MLFLQQFQNGKYKDINLTNIIYLKEPGKENSVIVISTTHLLNISLQTKKCLWVVPLDNIKQVKMRDEFMGVQLTLNNDSEGFSNRTPVIILNDIRLARTLY
jgi:hypothetical protein